MKKAILLSVLLVFTVSPRFCESILEKANLSGPAGIAMAREIKLIPLPSAGPAKLPVTLAAASDTAPAGAQDPGQAEKSEAAVGLPFSGRYALQFEKGLTEKELYEVVDKLGPLGITEVFSIQGPDSKITAIRLLVADFKDLESAKKRLAKLPAIKDSGFILKHKEHSYSLYASSYFDEKGALRDQARLAKMGIPTTLKPVQIGSTTYILIAGSFPTLQIAREKAAILQKWNLKASIIENPEKLPETP